MIILKEKCPNEKISTARQEQCKYNTFFQKRKTIGPNSPLSS